MQRFIAFLIPLFILGSIVSLFSFIAGYAAGYRPPEALDKCEVMVTKEDTLANGRQLYYVCPRVPTSVPLATTTPATTTPIKETKSETL